MVQLSAKAKELIPKAKIISFKSWQKTHPEKVIAILISADNDRVYLSDKDLQKIQALLPHTSSLISIAKTLRDHATEIVDEARKILLKQFPGITEFGGALYPPFRAEACWLDFWHFTRCVTYGIIGGSSQFTSSEGLGYMKLLYTELQVPLDAMVSGLESIKFASIKYIDSGQRQLVYPYFDHLIQKLSDFRNS